MYLALSHTLRNNNYHYKAWAGLLFSSKYNLGQMQSISQVRNGGKLPEILESVNNPFNINTTPLFHPVSKKDIFGIRSYAKLLIWLYRHFYFGLYLISHLRLKYYENAVEATDAFCRIIGEDSQDVMCLPRSVFAATTSKRFKEKGAMFIGAFLPSRHMHAWVIEDNCNSWRQDNKWINFVPVSVML